MRRRRARQQWTARGRSSSWALSFAPKALQTEERTVPEIALRLATRDPEGRRAGLQRQAMKLDKARVSQHLLGFGRGPQRAAPLRFAQAMERRDRRRHVLERGRAGDD